MIEMRQILADGISNADVLALAQVAHAGTIPSIRNERLIDNVLLARSVFKPNAYYGTRLAPDQCVLIDVDEFGGQALDLFITDHAGLPKNRVSDADMMQRVAQAREQGKKIIGMFGGSTTMGTGSRLPALTIPSLVEQILLIKYQIEAICINRGILGMTSQDSFNMLTADTFHTPLDCVIFYTGWNCVFNQSAIHALLATQHSSNIDEVFLGMSTRHIEHGIQLRAQFSQATVWQRALWLTINNIVTKISNAFGSKRLRRLLNQGLKMDPTVNHSFMSEVIERLTTADANDIAEKSSQDYQRLLRFAEACCKSEQVPFMNFLQPCLSWGHKPLTQIEENYVANSPLMGGVQQKFYDRVLASPQPYFFHPLGEIFDAVPEQVYIDTGHLNPYGNFIVAEKIADQIALANI